MLKRIHDAVLALLLVIMALPALAQEPVVYGVFFYSPSCPHCHEVIANHWPRIQAEFGDQLQVLFIDASNEAGYVLMQQARETLNIESNGVPMLIIGSEVLGGSIEIPTRTPEIVRAGLAAGGIGLPAIPGLQEIFQAAVEQEQAVEATAEATASSTAEAVPSPASTLPIEPPSLVERLVADPVANAAAVVMLILLVFSLLFALVAFWQYLVQSNTRRLQTMDGRLGRSMLTVLSIIGLGAAISLVAGWDQDGGVLLLAGGELAVFLVVLIIIRRSRPLPGWLIPLAALAGLAVAGYLAFVEMTLNEAVCGVVGNCNTVQQSEYARLFGIPIGAIGVAGYIGIAAAWALRRNQRWRLWMNRALVGMSLFGVAFSTYLTFLEPFVIGATCIWCLTSAVWMLVLLWLVLMLDYPIGVKAANQPEQPKVLSASPAR